MFFILIAAAFLVSHVFAEDSLKVSKIYVNTKDAFDDAVVHTPFERELYKFGNWFHIETKESVIRAKLPFGEGDAVAHSEIQDAEKNLRALPYISDAKIEAKRDSLGNTDLYVETSDNWTFAPTISLGYPSGKLLWEVGLLENNLLGFGHTVGFFFNRGEDRDQTYLLYRTDDFIFPHNKFNFQLSENTDGFSRYAGLSYPFISRAKNQWSYNAEWLWSKRDERYRNDIREDSLSLWLLRSFGGSSFKTYLGAGYDNHLLGSRSSRLGVSIAASRIKLDKRYNLHRVKWAEDVEFGYYIKSVIAKNFKELSATSDDWFFEHKINLSLGTREHYFLTRGQNSFYYRNNDSIRDMHSTLFGEYVFKPALEWSSVLNVQIDSWQETTFPRELYLDGYNIFPGSPSYYLFGKNTFAFKAEQRYFPGFEFLTYIPSFALFLTAGQATDKLREFEPRDLIYMAGIGLRGSPSKFVQGIVTHINLSWPLNGELKNGFYPRISFIGKVEL